MCRSFFQFLFLVLVLASARGGSLNLQTDEQSSTTEQNWYRDHEFNLSFWGTYAFTTNEHRIDQYLATDHAWGGGLDAKYFFSRYLGLGLSGFAISARQSVSYIHVFADMTSRPTVRNPRTVGGGLGTITLRYPIGASRFSPYLYLGGGVIVGGGERLKFESVDVRGQPGGTDSIRAYYSDDYAAAMGQLGGGLEIRLTPHIGIITDLNWNVIDGPGNDFGFVRSGLNLAF